MRIVGGEWRGRRLAAPSGAATRPTTDRVRQALFDMLSHASWAGPGAIAGSAVLDAFAGTGALGLEALSRGAAHATFVERDRTALAALRTNVAACGAESRSLVLAGDVLGIGPGAAFDLMFLDPPYGAGLVMRALERLRETGRIVAGTLIVAETAREEPPVVAEPLAVRAHGPTRLTIWREAAR